MDDPYGAFLFHICTMYESQQYFLIGNYNRLFTFKNILFDRTLRTSFFFRENLNNIFKQSFKTSQQRKFRIRGVAKLSSNPKDISLPKKPFIF